MDHLTLQRQIQQLKAVLAEKDERDLMIMKDLSNAHRELQERVLVLETSYEHVVKLLVHIQKETSLQVRLTISLITALVSAAVGFLIKLYVAPLL